MDAWTIYDHPRDFPDDYVARRFELIEADPVPTADFMVCGDIAPLREFLAQRGLTCFKRAPSDDPVIVETWL